MLSFVHVLRAEKWGGSKMPNRKSVPEKLRIEVMSKANNRCCVCQTPFFQIHHLDGDPSNNDPDNLAPLCPNCHDQADLKRSLSNSLTADRIRALRDRWYAYCEARKAGSNVSTNAILKMKNFQRSMAFADISWRRTFSSLDSSYGKMSPNEIIDQVFSTTNPDDLTTYLETVKNMYRSKLVKEENLKKFKQVCAAFGVDYDNLI